MRRADRGVHTPPSDPQKRTFDTIPSRKYKNWQLLPAALEGGYRHRGTSNALQAGFTEDGKRIEFVRIAGEAVSHQGKVCASARGKALKGVGIALAPTKNESSKAAPRVMGERDASSRHPALNTLGVAVTSIVIGFRRQAKVARAPLVALTPISNDKSAREGLIRPAVPAAVLPRMPRGPPGAGCARTIASSPRLCPRRH